MSAKAKGTAKVKVVKKASDKKAPAKKAKALKKEKPVKPAMGSKEQFAQIDKAVLVLLKEAKAA